MKKDQSEVSEGRVNNKSTSGQQRKILHKQAEEALRRYELLARYSRDIILFVRRDDGRILEANAAATSAYGYTHEELLTRSIHDLRAPETRGLTADQMGEADREGILFETFHRRKDGSTFPVEVSSQGATMGATRALISVVRDVTARKQAEEARRESEEFLRMTFEYASVGMAIGALDQTFARTNAAFDTMLGYERGELTGVHWSAVTPPDEAAQNEDLYPRFVKTGMPNIAFEKRYVRKDGAVIWADVNVSLVRDVDGKARFGIAMVQDITERKRAQELLQEYEKAVEGSDDMIAIIDRDYRYRLANAAFLKYRGMCKEEVIGRSVKEILGRDVFEHVVKKNLDKCFRGEVVHYEMKRTYPELGERELLVSYLPIRGSERVDRVTTIIRDITDRKRAGEALQKAHNELEQRVLERTAVLEHQAYLLDLSHDAIFVRDMAGVITYWSAGAEALYGWAREEALGRISRELLHTVLPKPAGSIKAEVVRVGRWEGELRQRRKDGSELTVLSRLTLQRDEEGRPVAILATHTDITQQRHLEEQLRQSQKMEALGTFAGGIAHDFNNILQSILGFTEMAVEDVSDRPDVEKNLRNVLKSSVRARDLVEQILAFGRKTSYARSPVSLSPFIKETVQLLRASIPANIDIVLNMTATTDMVLAAPVEVQQLLMNLGSNASLAMQEKGGTLEISVNDIYFQPDSPALEQGVTPGEYVQLVVKDTGTGMTPDLMKRIFEPFFTTRGVGKGTGMGLAVVYGIVKSLKGTITVESEPGVGSTFRIFLPKAEAEAKAEPVKPVAAGGHESILFVDDEDLLAQLNGERLKSLGYEVVTTTSSREALAIFRAEPERFDLVITDYTMPHLTGIDLANQLLTIRGDIPIILCTGHSDAVSPEIAKEKGIRAFLMKPLSKQEMAEAIRRVLDSKAGS